MCETRCKTNVRVGTWVAAVLLFLLVMQGVASAFEVPAEDDQVTLLNPFSYERIVIKPKAIPSIIVLRSMHFGEANRLANNPTLPNSLSIGTSGSVVFRNSIIRMPITHQVRSKMVPDPE